MFKYSDYGSTLNILIISNLDKFSNPLSQYAYPMYKSRKILNMDKLKTRTKLFYWCVIYAPMVSCLHIII